MYGFTQNRSPEIGQGSAYSPSQSTFQERRQDPRTEISSQSSTRPISSQSASLTPQQLQQLFYMQRQQTQRPQQVQPQDQLRLLQQIQQMQQQPQNQQIQQMQQQSQNQQMQQQPQNQQSNEQLQRMIQQLGQLNSDQLRLLQQQGQISPEILRVLQIQQAQAKQQNPQELQRILQQQALLQQQAPKTPLTTDQLRAFQQQQQQLLIQQKLLQQQMAATTAAPRRQEPPTKTERRVNSTRGRKRSPPRGKRESSPKQSPPRRKKSPPPKQTKVVEKRKKEEEERELERKYLVHIPSNVIGQFERSYLDIKKRYPRLFISEEFTKIVANWTETIPLDNPLNLSYYTPFYCEYLSSDKKEQKEKLEDPFRDSISPSNLKKYNAKAVLLSGYGDGEQQKGHLSNILKLLVAKEDRSDLMCLGGEWSSSKDGGDPALDNQVLIKSVIRHVKEQTQVDLSNCKNWVRFLEIHYHRYKTNMDEITVIFIPNMQEIAPSGGEFFDRWNEVQKLKKRKKRD